MDSYLVEFGLIGSIGGILGIIICWLITRLTSLITKAYMFKEGIDVIEIDFLLFRYG